MNKKATILTCVAAAVLLGGGYFLADAMNCRGLEEDYLNAVSSLKTRTMAGVVIPEAALSRSDEKLRLDDIGVKLGLVYDQCGMRAGQTAARKSAEISF